MAFEEALCMFYLIPGLILLVFRLIITPFIYSDAKNHGIDPVMWTIIGFILGIIGLIVYWVFKEDVYKKRARQMYGYGYPQPYPYGQPSPYGGGQYVQRPEYRRGLDPDVICDGCGHIVKNVPIGGVLFCENCGKQVKTQYGV